MPITINKPGKEYTLKTIGGQQIAIVFLHKENGQLIDGLTTEDILEMLEHRQSYMLSKSPSDENLSTIVHLRQALHFCKARAFEKLKKKHGSKIQTYKEKK